MNDLPELSETERLLLDQIRAHRKRHGHSPSWEQLRAAMGWRSTRSVGYHLESLREKGYVVAPADGAQRSIELTETRPAGMPMIGVVAAGSPLPPGDDQGRFVFEDYFSGDDLATLLVKGDSMIEACIDDGDLVVVKRDPDPPTGTKVVASIDGELTLKRLSRVGKAVVLLPYNRDAKKIVLRPDENTFIVGVLVGVIRKY